MMATKQKKTVTSLYKEGHLQAKQNKYFVSWNPTDRANNVPTVTYKFINILKGEKRTEKKNTIFFGPEY